MATITVDGLTKRFGAVQAVDDLSFEISGASVTGFLGPNGAGKTTTLRMLLGLVTPDRGRAVLEKRRYVELDEPARVVGALLEATSFHPGRSARNHLRMVARATGLPDRRADEVLEEVGLVDAARRRVGGFSLGMRQRLGLATALLGEPEVLVLDEPTNGLDPAGVRWLRDLLRSMAADGRTVLVSSHLLSEVARTVDRVVVIDRGRLVAEGPVTDLTLAGESLEDAFLRLTNLTEGDTR
jgi:ABC-2 type transport system ATP-binding protein